MLNKFDIKTVLIISMLVAGLLPLTISGIAMLSISNTALEEQSYQQLEAIETLKSSQIESYFSTIDKQVQLIAQEPGTVDAAINFSQAFEGFSSSQANEPSLEEQLKSVRAYYKDAFGAEYQSQNGTAISIDSLIPTEPKEIRAQYWYISNNPNPLGSKSELFAASDNRG